MENGIYGILSEVYDEINGELDYSSWADFVCEIFHRHGKIEVHDLLDLACGTGRMTVELARRGYSMVGVDLSPEMLARASDAAEAAGVRDDLLLLCQDMCDFELYGTVEAAVCCLDSLNHLTDTKKLRRCFELLHNYIAPEGLFVFDLNTERKFREVYGSNAYVFECEEGVVTWQNYYNEKRGVCDFLIDFFRERSDGAYERFSECQRERLWSRRTVERMVRECGFELIGVYGDMAFRPADAADMREYYVIRRI